MLYFVLSSGHHVNEPSANLPPVIRRMLERDFYPHPTSDPITLIQTHISYILLTGEFAYKVKKPVNPGFLDFTTLERRHFFCNEELRLNQCGAPSVYLTVEAICQEGGNFRLNGPGRPVEYAVKMRQLPQEGLFSSLLARDRLTSELMERLARTIADSHASAETNPHISNFGMPERVRQIIDGNYVRTRKFVGTLQTRAQLEQTKAFTDEFFRDHLQLLERRVADGHIRECHGDLHLNNVCLWGDKVLLFDCIEFSESLRCVDVVQDAAFAAMDLQALGRADLAALFINTYFERTGDWEGIQLLRLYLCRHAYVRAMVNSLFLNEPEIAPEAAKGARKTAVDYYRLAWEYAQPRQGRVILVSGVSGSGKSTLARQLALRIGTIHLRSDAVRKHLAGVPLDQKGDQNLYSEAMSERTYARLLDLGLLLANAGYVVLLDAKYDRRARRRAAAGRAQAAGVSLRIVHCTAPRRVIHDRLVARAHDISDAGPELLERQEQTFEDFEDDERRYLTAMDTSSSIDQAKLERALAG